MNDKINLQQKLALLDEPYRPGIVGYMNADKLVVVTGWIPAIIRLPGGLRRAGGRAPGRSRQVKWWGSRSGGSFPFAWLALPRGCRK